VKDGRVDPNGVLPSHKIVNDLQHRPIKGGRMVKPKDVALDLASNAMYVAKVVLAFSPLSCSAHRAPIIVMYLIKGRGSLWCGLLGTCV